MGRFDQNRRGRRGGKAVKNTQNALPHRNNQLRRHILTPLLPVLQMNLATEQNMGGIIQLYSSRCLYHNSDQVIWMNRCDVFDLRLLQMNLDPETHHRCIHSILLIKAIIPLFRSCYLDEYCWIYGSVMIRCDVFDLRLLQMNLATEHNVDSTIQLYT